jgi:hypothetical protein
MAVPAYGKRVALRAVTEKSERCRQGVLEEVPLSIDDVLVDASCENGEQDERDRAQGDSGRDPLQEWLRINRPSGLEFEVVQTTSAWDRGLYGKLPSLVSTWFRA